MAEEYLFSIELNQDKTKEHWDPQPEQNEEDGEDQNFGVDQKLIVKMVILGKDAKVGEQNIVQIEAMGLKGKFKTPIAILEMGKCPQILLDLSIPDSPVTFELISGSGPVHIVGHNLLANNLDEYEDVDEEEVEVNDYDDEDDEKDDKEEDEDEEEIEEPKKRKTKQPAKNQVNKKQKKN
ncbi:nucleoplasmin-like protein isoform X1 [Trichogramma pretiosum]|uniref:nucleoplasmin-like protein isoform X1 n=1 Tax=Trichogramma pretiosum TaxID=7493 RepID=UPI0006C9E59D|nr:nucleoplasmin-like protein isoform X1 [Trichogramma pretiosum]